MPTLLIALGDDSLTDAHMQQIAAIAPDMDIVYTQDKAKVQELLDDIEIAVGGPPRDLLFEMPNLRWFQQWGAGADWLMRYPQAQEKDFIVTNTAGMHAVQISEHILAFMLSFARKFPMAYSAQQNKEWAHTWGAKPDIPGAYPLFELYGQTALIIGVGAIGQRTAKLCKAFDMHVIGVRRNPEKSVNYVDEMVGNTQLMKVLPRADWVIITAPLTPETQHMIGKAELDAMKSSAFIINIGRGEIIDEPALIEALQSASIAGAGLDVFETEPLPQESPLWELENVIATCHYSGLTPHYHERAFEIFIDNLRQYQAGEPLHHVVDKVLAY